MTKTMVVGALVFSLTGCATHGADANPSQRGMAAETPTKEESSMEHDDENTWDWNDAYTGTESDVSAPDALVLKTVLALQPGKALDVGCGAGGLLIALAAAGWAVTGIDLADKAIAAAQAAFKARGREAELHVGDATTWAPPTSYDLITNAFALPVSQVERSAVFQMVKKATAPGGVFVLKEFDAGMDRDGSPFAGTDLVSLAELNAAFADWSIERAEIVSTPAHAAEAAHGTPPDYTAAFFVARRPQ